MKSSSQLFGVGPGNYNISSEIESAKKNKGFTIAGKPLKEKI
jgi:hypothetical protein